MTRILEVSGLSKNFGGLKAVQDLSFHVTEGEAIGLIGPNGAGKSTAFNLISGAIKPTSGKVRLNERDITGFAPSRVVKHGLARTFQSASVYPSVTVAENIYRGAISSLRRPIWLEMISGGPMRVALARVHKEIDDILELTGLGPCRNKLAGGLPYGHQKKLGVAIGIATRPQLLLLDEPAAGLNPEECAEFGSLLDVLRIERKMSLLLVEHHMALVMGLCHRIVVLVQGKKIAEGTPEEIAGNPAVVEAYLGAPDYAHS